MGKRARKTRWRALDIADEHSDSEESNTNSSAVSSRNSRSYINGFYSKYSYSSQSTPARRRHNQYDGSAKSTRSSSTTSENKITFNEDEYTRITTPRQDVLFKKGYLNKPKNYHTQTSTGNSTISTGNSTENGTPDHQSTDLDYESQFMFPNGFVDQNGIYYVNSYEPYPLMLFNPPTYYQECSNVKSKRMSTGSLSESMSPNNEEATSQDLSPSGGDASNSVSDYNSGGPPMYNMVTYGYYVNGTCTPTGLTNGHHSPAEPVKKLKKRRERKSSKNIQDDDSSEYTDENSCDETPEAIPENSLSSGATSPSENNAEPASRLEASGSVCLQKSQNVSPEEAQLGNSKEEELKTVCENSGTLLKGCADSKTESNDDKSEFDQAQPISSECTKLSVLKPDAEEFIPRAYQNLGPPPHIKMLPSNFMPIPLVPINDFAGQSFAPHPAFIPSGIPINFIHHHPGPKMFTAAPGFVNFPPPIIPETKIEEISDQNDDIPSEEKESTATPQHTPVLEESKPVVHSKTIDIATVVSKLEAVKQQENEVYSSQSETASGVVNETKPFIGSPRFKKSTTFKRNYYNRYRCSPVRSGNANYPNHHGNCITNFERSFQNDKNNAVLNSSVVPQKHLSGEPLQYINVPVRPVEVPLSEQNGFLVTLEHPNTPTHQVNVSSNVPNEPASQTLRETPVRCTGVTQVVQNAHVNEQPLENGTKYSETNPVKAHITNGSRVRSSPDQFKKNWKPNGYQNSGQYGYNSPRRSHYPNTQNQKTVIHEIKKTNTNSDLSPTLNKIYSETLKKGQNVSVLSSPQYRKHINTEKSIKTAENMVDVSNMIDIQPKSNQWIPVSNKKKKKYKNIEEIDINVDQDVVEPAQTDASSDFESYDVNQLVDVVPSLILEPNGKNEQNIEDILTIIAKNESSEILANGTENSTNIKIPEVSDIEKEIIIKMEEQKDMSIDDITKEAVTQIIQPKKNKVILNTEIVPSISDEQKEENFRPKKKSRKGTQKPLTRKIIITDIDLSMDFDVKSPAKKANTETKNNNSDKHQLEQPVPVFREVSAKETEPEVLSESTDKKPKKKKKNKSSKSIQVDSVTSTNVTTTDESYDSLLETNLESGSPDKTNDDISLELEKLIQKGMYNSLHEKIKSINVELEADGFFKSFQAVSSVGKEKTPTANGFMKAPDFNKIFQSTRQFLKPNMVSVEQDISDSKVAIDDNKDTKSSSSTPDAAYSSAGLFLDNSQEIQEAPTEVATDSVAPVQNDEDQEDTKKLYPITQAVKEWMSKTREATPEVEILKSPTTIQKEFGDIDSSICGLNDPWGSDDEDEVILFSNEAVEQDDLLDYWENDVTSPETTITDYEELKDCSEIPKMCSDRNGCIKCQSTFINEGEEKIKVYESKYGQNNAFLKLHRELKEKQTNSSRSENFPSRSICCCLQ